MSKKSSIASEDEPDFICEANEADRNEMIATAAFYRSERRGFNNGNAMQDWLEAEAEIDN